MMIQFSHGSWDQSEQDAFVDRAWDLPRARYLEAVVAGNHMCHPNPRPRPWTIRSWGQWKRKLKKMERVFLAIGHSFDDYDDNCDDDDEDVDQDEVEGDPELTSQAPDYSNAHCSVMMPDEAQLQPHLDPHGESHNLHISVDEVIIELIGIN